MWQVLVIFMSIRRIIWFKSPCTLPAPTSPTGSVFKEECALKRPQSTNHRNFILVSEPRDFCAKAANHKALLLCPRNPSLFGDETLFLNHPKRPKSLPSYHLVGR